MSILNNSPDEPKKSTIKSSHIKVGNSFCLGEKRSIQDEKIDVTSEDFLSKLTPALSKKIKDTIQAAEQKAQNIIQNAQVEAEALKQRAQEQGAMEGQKVGQQQGYQAGFTQINNELSAKLESFDKLISDVINSKNEIYRSGEEELLEFVMLISEKLAHSKIKEDKEVLKNIIVDASVELREKENIKILINPSLAGNLYSISEEIKQAIYGLENIKILEDRTVSADGVVIESVDSRIDARLSSQVEILMAKLKENKKTKPIMDIDEKDA